MKKAQSTKSGNVLFLILIAVALFAALSYAVTQSSKTSGGSVDKDKARLQASEIVNFMGSVKAAVDRVMLINKCAFNQLAFENNVYENTAGALLRPDGGNPDAPADKSCHIFHTNGGGVQPYIVDIKNPHNYTGVYKPGHGADSLRVIDNIGSSVSDLTFHFADIDEEVCKAFNDLNGVDNPGGSPPVETATTPSLGDEDAALIGQYAFCYYRNAGKPRNFIHYVLFQR